MGSQSDARYPRGRRFSLCRFLRMSFSVPAPDSHRSVVLLAPIGGGRGRIISHSDGHSVFNCPSVGSQREVSKINPLNNQLGTFLPFARKNFCKLFVNGGYNDKKSRYTAHQISGRKSPAISLMKLCTGSEIQKPSMSAFSVPQAYAATGAAQPQSLSAAALSFIQIFSCGSPMRAYKLYYAEHLFVKRFWHTAAEKRLPFPTAALGLII